METERKNKLGAIFSGAILAALFSLLFIIQMPTAAQASENIIGLEISIDGHAGEDVSILGADIYLDSSEAGDVSIVGAEVVVEGGSNGDVSIAGGEVSFTGDVAGELAIAGGEVTVESNVTGEVSIAGGDVSFTGSGQDVHLLGGEVDLDGVVHGSLYVGADEFNVSPGTVIHGDFEFRGPREPTLPADLTVMGAYSYEYSDLDDLFEGDLPAVIFPVIAIAGVAALFSMGVLLMGLFAFGLIAMVFLVLFPGFLSRSIDGIRERPISSIGMGILVLAAMMLLALLLCLTIIGIPVAMMVLFSYPMLMFMGFFMAVLGIPYLLLRKDHRDVGSGAKIGIFMLSMIVLLLLFAVPVVGQLLLAVFVLMGVGAFGAAVLGGRRESAAA